MRSSDGLFAFSSIAARLFALLPCLGAFGPPSLPQQSNHGKGEATTAKEKQPRRACARTCQGPPQKTEPFQSHLAKATRQLSSQF